MAEAGITVRILIRGNTGVGKTSLILNECHRRSLPMTMTEGGEINSPEDWFGETRMNEHGTYFIPRPFTRGVETTNCVNFMDELPRVRTPQCLNPLMGLMSDLRSAYCHSLDRAIVAAPGTMFVATANVGRQFTGNITIDDATLNRFSYTIDMDYLPQEQEQKLLVERCQLASPTARSLVNFARSLRDQHEAQSLPFAPSTRTLIDVANLITWGGANPQEAVEEVIFPRYRKLEDDNDALNKVELSLQGQFPAPTVSMPAPGGHDAPGRSADSPADADPGDQATAFFAVTVTDRQAQSYLKPLHRNEALQQAFLEKLRATGF
jgi:MoxR-like ATPase